MGENYGYGGTRRVVPPTPQMEGGQQDQSCNAMRAATPMELQQIEQKHAAAMQQCMFGFLGFPTPQNFQLLQTAAGEYMAAWMNGRKRVLSD